MHCLFYIFQFKLISLIALYWDLRDLIRVEIVESYF